MSAEEFLASAGTATPPAGTTGPLLGLWHAAKGDWDSAHKIVQDDSGAAAAWVHAHLHRIEGDLDNARYWYGMAGRRVSTAPLDEERIEIARSLLEMMIAP
jgi:hypothetical protein